MPNIARFTNDNSRENILATTFVLFDSNGASFKNKLKSVRLSLAIVASVQLNCRT